MTIEQIVEIPADRRIVLQVPPEVPTGRTSVIIQFPMHKTSVKKRMTEAEEMEYFRIHAEELNAETMDALSYQCWNPLENDDQ
ncbi:MAG: hypothetical protein FWD78_09475 [Treponema sp.]|nr:hypothetical protein [Treponema sp.]